MTLPLLALVVAQTGTLDLTAQKELQVPVTMKMRAKRMPLALAEIGKTGGVKLSSGPEFENEPLIVVVDNVSLASLMDQTAKAAGGQWIKTGEEFRLLRPSVLVEKFRLQERQWIRESLRRASEVPLEEPLDLKIHTALLRLIKPEFVEGLSPLDRVVFSDKPSAWQVPAGAVGRELMQLGVQKWRADKAANDAQIEDSTKEEVADDYFVPVGRFPPDALRVVAYWATPYLLCIDFPSPMFWEVGDENQPVAPSPLYPQYAKFRTTYTKLISGDNEESETVLKDSSKPLVFGSPYNGFVNLLNVLDNSRPPGKASSPDFERMAAKPDEYDPLSFAVTDYFITLAEDQELNLVSIPTDDLFELSIRRDESDVDLTFSGYTDTINNSDRMRVSRDDSFLRIEPAWKIREHLARQNRKALRKVIDQSRKPEGITLAAGAEFAASVPDFSLDIVDAYAQVTDMQRWNFPTTDTRELRFYNSLSFAQREEFLSGQKFAYIQLSPPQRLAFRRMISFTSGSSGEISMPDLPAAGPDADREISEFIEITDIVTTQVEQAIQFYSKRESGNVVGLAEYNGFPSKQPAFTPGFLGYMRHTMETQTHSVENGIIPDFNRYYLGTRNEYLVEVLFPPLLKRSLSLEEIRYSPKVLRYEELPPDFRTSADDAYNRIRNRRNRP